MEPAGWAAIARPVAAPPPVEERDRDATLPAESGEAELGFRELPVGREEAPVFVRVGVADHHLEGSAPLLGAHAAAHQRHLQQIAHDVGRPSQIVDRFEQRHDRERAALHARGVGEQPRLLREEVDAQDVGDIVRHTEDEGPDRLAVETAPDLMDQTEQVDRLGGVRRGG